MRVVFAVICTALVSGACVSVAQPAVPALIVEPTNDSHAELTRIVSEALNAPSVTIASSALTRESRLIIERQPARDATGQRLSGRDYGAPEHFQLVKEGTQCVLIHQETSTRYELTKSTCVGAVD